MITIDIPVSNYRQTESDRFLTDILAEIKSAEVLSLDSSETLKQLTQNAVKNLAKELKSKKIKNLFVK